MGVRGEPKVGSNVPALGLYKITSPYQGIISLMCNHVADFLQKVFY